MGTMISCKIEVASCFCFLALPLVAVFLLVCFQLIQDMMHEFVFLLWEVYAIETRKRQGGRRKPGPADNRDKLTSQLAPIQMNPL